MTRTINGKSFEQVLNELKEHFKYIWYDNNDFTYIPVSEIEKRLDEVLGLNWSFELIKDPEFIKFEEPDSNSKQSKEAYRFVCTGSISIFDDNGNLVSRRVQGGGSDVIILKSSGKMKDISSDYKSAISDALKKCAKAFGVARYLDDMKNEDKKRPYKPDSISELEPSKATNIASNSSKTGNKAEKSMKLVLLSKGRTNTRGLNYDVADKDGRKGTLIIWNNSDLIKNEIKLKKLNELPINTAITVKCTENLYKNELQFNCTDIAI